MPNRSLEGFPNHGLDPKGQVEALPLSVRLPLYSHLPRAKHQERKQAREQTQGRRKRAHQQSARSVWQRVASSPVQGALLKDCVSMTRCHSSLAASVRSPAMAAA